MAQLQSQKAAKDERRKLLSKTEVIRWLLLTLPALEAKFMQAMNTIKQEFTLSYVPTFEREARREGKQEEPQEGCQEGKLEGETGLFQRQLIRKFGPLSQDLQQRIQSGTPEQLETWTLNILDAKTLEHVFKH